MILQKLECLTSGEPDLNSDLYVRTNRTSELHIVDDSFDNSLEVFPKETISFDTYFNSFSIEKWLKYTVIDQIDVQIAYSGHINVELFGVYDEAGQLTRVKVDDYELHSDIKDSGAFHLPIDQLKDARICYLTITNVSDEEKAQVYQINYQTQCEPVRDVHMAVSICTFKREKDLYRNLDIVEKYLVNNKNSVLFDNLSVLVVDNGHTVKSTDRKWLRVVENKNCGGAAGFSRGMMEISNDGRFTHILLMDDDVIIKPSAIEKTYLLLLYLKRDKDDYIIGGAMFRRDFPFVQHEAGGRYDNGRIESVRNGKDLREFNEVYENEEIVPIDYNAWWYCCIPINIVKDKGYALPLFIHQDDIEYGIRAGRHVLTMNGINVWHESFEQKRPSSNEYYDVRNILVVNSAMHADYKLHVAVRRVVIRMLTNMFRYRYNDVRLVAKAVDDFCKGPGWLMDVDGELLNNEVRSIGYSYNQPFDSEDILFKETISLEDVLGGFNNSQKLNLKKVLLLNGNLLPANTRDKIVPIPAGHSPHEFYRVKNAWIYDPDIMKGFYVRKSFSGFWMTIGLVISKSVKLSLNYNKKRREYSEAYVQMRSDAFWRKYLGL